MSIRSDSPDSALAEWGACILYVLLLRRKVTGWKLPVSLAGSLLVFIAYQEFAGTLPIYFWIPCMIGAAFLMCLLLHLLCDTTWLDAGFCCAQALVLAEFTASFHWQLYVWWALNYAKNSRLFSTLTMLLLYTGIYIGYYFLERGHFPTDERLLVNGKDIITVYVFQSCGSLRCSIGSLISASIPPQLPLRISLSHA